MGFSINTVTISGNLTRDPELRQAGEASVCQLRIAHNGRRKDRSGEWVDVPYYFDVQVWRGQGEWIARNLSKGDAVVVQGDLRWREWESGDGSKRQSVDINAVNVTTMSKGGGGGGGRSSSDGGYRERYEPDVPIDSGDLPAPGAQQPVRTSDEEIPF